MKTKHTPAMAFDENLVFRPAKMADLSEAVALFNACSLDLIGIDEYAENFIHTMWAEPGMNLETDTRIVMDPDGRAVAYIEVWDTAPHVRIYGWGLVHPDYRGTGLGTRLAWWSETRARQSVSKAPSHARVGFYHWCYGADEAAKTLFLNRGYEFTRQSFHMQIDMNGAPPKVDWPHGLDGQRPIYIRTLTPGAEIEVLKAVLDAFKDHWGHVEKPFDEEKERWLHWINSDENHDPSLWFLAMDGDEIAGISLCQKHANGQPDLGWVETLGVRRPWRRRGVGLALLQHSFQEYFQRGMTKVGLEVDAESLTGATRLYEKAGMHIARQSNTYEKELRPGEELSTQSVD